MSEILGNLCAIIGCRETCGPGWSFIARFSKMLIKTQGKNTKILLLCSDKLQMKGVMEGFGIPIGNSLQANVSAFKAFYLH